MEKGGKRKRSEDAAGLDAPGEGLDAPGEGRQRKNKSKRTARERLKRFAAMQEKIEEEKIITEQRMKYQLTDEEDIEWTPQLRSLWGDITKNQFILVSGKAGTGKSYLLRQLTDLLEDHSNITPVVVAPTSIAAVNAGGITMHRWFSMGLADKPLDKLKNKIKFGQAATTIRNVTETDLLLVDEVSMVDPVFFEKVAKICQYIHESRKNFGNIKIVFFGDFLQLPAITKKDSAVKFLFQSQTWRNMNVHRILLRHVYRQSDPVFVKTLNLVRKGIVNQFVVDTLLPRMQTPTGMYTRLCSYRKTVKEFNMAKLLEIPGPPIVYTGIVEPKPTRVKRGMCPADLEGLDKIIPKALESFNIPQEFHVKVGAHVMYRANDLVGKKICNGSIGVVMALTDDVITVQFDQFDTMMVPVQRQDLFVAPLGKTAFICLNQFPLTLAWAMSIHKSQGVTLNRALVDTNCFEDAQFYVAISRLRSLDGLYLKCPGPPHPRYLDCIKANPEAVKFEDDNVYLLLLLAAKHCKKSKFGEVFQQHYLADLNIISVIRAFL